MFITFFTELKSAGIPVSLREYLTLMEALDKDLAEKSVEDFYYLARLTLVKDESNLDKFDRVFGHVFKGLDLMSEVATTEIPEEWLRRLAEKHLSEEEKAQIEALGGFEKLMETLRERLKEQQKRHQGGNKWIGTAGTSPFGAYGYNPEGVRIGQHESRHRRAVKVWDKREFKDLDDTQLLGTRNIQVALKRLRNFARTGAAEELDLDDTIRATAHKGLLDIKMRPERHNAVKVLLFFDIGGSMDDHIRVCEELFSAARSEFKVMEHFYFHNCLYEYVWKENRRRHTERMPTMDVLHKYPADYKIIFVGDASMSPYEIAYAGGSVEHWNEEAGADWMQRITGLYKSAVWLNPVRQEHWHYTHSIQMLNELMEGRMFPMTVEGLTDAMKELAR
ncbi:vWA domain-containing protein [Roseibium aggregatum]|uniref:vWA domain-containing protein n=1 Tax=Roseibium aggregatum TaxID=187304 RepID=UPI001A8EF767|nr:VWA domain-containing protein [Roseibium aggregatum]MBN8182102.1 VWA domain-containing protein [Roseibium aggregatum]UES39619.1 VWA domain-containing protein [Roseibium aggregatum]UES43941.1 VWA domain-containing protein [Roseibium aggregatum]